MVAALILDAADRAAIERTLARRTPVRMCDRVDALRSLVAAAEVGAVAAELRDLAGASAIPVLAETVARAAPPAIIVRTHLTDAAAGDVLRFAAARIAARLTIRETDPSGTAMVAALGNRHGAPAADLVILERVGPFVPGPLRAFAVLSASGALPRLHVARAAALLGIGRRTLEARLTRAFLPPAHRIIGWCAALNAAWQLDVLGLRPKQVAARLGFSSGAALANLLGRYCECSATSLREHGGFQVQLERFAHLFERKARAV